MSVAKQIVLPAVLVLALGAGGLDAARAQAADSPQQVLQLWQAALEGRDYPAYVACLHTGARPVPEYGSREAMAFWAGEMRDLVGKGFTGQYELEVVTDGGDRFPPGSVRAYPIVNGQPIGDAIVLVQEAGHWTILRIFS